MIFLSQKRAVSPAFARHFRMCRQLGHGSFFIGAGQLTVIP